MNSNTPSPSAAAWLREVLGWTDRGGPPLAIEWDTFEQKSGRTWVRDKKGRRWTQAEIIDAYAKFVISRLAEEAEREARQVNRVDPWFEFADWLRAKAEEM